MNSEQQAGPYSWTLDDKGDIYFRGFEPLAGDPDRIVDRLNAQHRQIEGLQEEVVEYLEAIMYQEGAAVTSGDRKGWWDSMCMSNVNMAGRRLAELGKWEVHPDGFGRRWFYRPIRKADHAND